MGVKRRALSESMAAAAWCGGNGGRVGGLRRGPGGRWWRRSGPAREPPAAAGSASGAVRGRTVVRDVDGGGRSIWVASRRTWRRTRRGCDALSTGSWWSLSRGARHRALGQTTPEGVAQEVEAGCLEAPLGGLRPCRTRSSSCRGATRVPTLNRGGVLRVDKDRRSWPSDKDVHEQWSRPKRPSWKSATFQISANQALGLRRSRFVMVQPGVGEVLRAPDCLAASW